MIMLQHKWDRAESLRECNTTQQAHDIDYLLYHVSKATKATKATIKQKSINKWFPQSLWSWLPINCLWKQILVKFPFDSIRRYHHFTIHFELNFKKQRYCKIPIISPWFIFVLRFFLIHLFSGKLIFGVCYF